MIGNIRTLSQQLSQPKFSSPSDLITWMGAMQAQDYNMAKWALGIRMQSPSIQIVQQALDNGDIIRTHVMRPTWHFVPTEDIRWMLPLSAKRLTSANKSMSKNYDISESDFTKCNKLFEKILSGNNHLTKLELAAEIDKRGSAAYSPHIYRLLLQAETNGLICSGVDKGGKPTYALLEERVPPAKELHKDEALALLATRYFQSHSPATLNDFVWWSGLPITQARHAIHLIGDDIIEDQFATEKFYVHQSCSGNIQSQENVLELLPSYDEYLISYKDRTAVLPLELYSKAFNNYGIFYPIIMLNGKIVGNWKKAVKKGEIEVETSFFDPKLKIEKAVLETAIEKYRTFMSK